MEHVVIETEDTLQAHFVEEDKGEELTYELNKAKSTERFFPDGSVPNDSMPDVSMPDGSVPDISNEVPDFHKSDNEEFSDNAEHFSGAGNMASQIFFTESQAADDTGSVFDVRADTDVCDSDTDKDSDRPSMCGSDDPVKKRQEARVSAQSHSAQITRSQEHDDVDPALGTISNTPASCCFPSEHVQDAMNVDSRNTSQAGLDSMSETVFHQAMTLMSDRCVSAPRGWDASFMNMAQVPYGPQLPQYFFVHQHRPMPMPPLKVWKGYHGNMYFEPLSITRVGTAGSCAHGGEVDNKSRRLGFLHRGADRSDGSKHQTGHTSHLSTALVAVRSGEDRQRGMESQSSFHNARNMTHIPSSRRNTSPQHTASSAAAVCHHHILVLDKQAVMNPRNTFMEEELQVIESQKSTGSLAVNLQQKTSVGDASHAETGGGASKPSRKPMKSASFDRICKGSVTRQLRTAKSSEVMETGLKRSDGNEERHINGAPFYQQLMVVGDRFVPPSVMSPLLRTQTQFSLSSQRLTMNSPDLYSAFEHLPPLEQVRISLRQMDSHGEDLYASRMNTPYSGHRRVAPVEDLKPFIKYSPDVRARYSKQVSWWDGCSLLSDLSLHCQLVLQMLPGVC